MALRRLFSGWLIAVAAFARSMAQVLERAAAVRSEPTPDPVPGPVMAALAERYRGAPDHWLALVAERTAQLAEAGEAPLSLSSQASAWPVSLPGAAGPLEPLVSAEEEGISLQPPRPVAQAASRPDSVPSLAALEGRSSEVWRRPAASPAHRPRPVFAPVEPVPPRVISPSPSVAQPVRRSRSPLVLASRPTSSSPREMPSPIEPPPEAMDGPVWPEATRSDPERSLVASPSAPPAPDSATGSEAADPTEPHSRWAGAPVAPSVSRSLSGGASATASSVRNALAFGPSIDAPPRDTAPAQPNRPAVLDARTADRPAFSPSPARPALRRAIFRALAVLGGKTDVPYLSPHQAKTKTLSPGTAAVPADPGARSSAARPDVFQTTPSPASPAATALNDRTHTRDDPPIRAEPRVAMTPSPATPRPTWTEGVANDEPPRDPRATFAIPHPPSTRNGSFRRAQSLDDRWPKFPPTLFAPPAVAEIPSPRLDQLAREQEEGRWSV